MTASSSPSDPVQSTPEWTFRLYVAGKTEKSVAAYSNLKQICEAYLKGRYAIEIIDLIENPSAAKRDDIIAVPTLVRKLPTPVKKLIGSLAEKERVIVGLQLREADQMDAGVTR